MSRVRKQYGIKELSDAIRNVSHKVRHFREEAGLSQNELAKRAGIGQSTVNELENSVAADIQLSTLCLIARALKRPVPQLLSNSDIDITDQDQELLLKAVDEIGKNHNTIRSLAKRLKK